MNLEISDGNMTDKTRVVFDDSKAEQYDSGIDANKFLSMEAVPQIYTLDAKDVKYSVNNRPSGSREVRLGVVVPAEGTYTINMPLADCNMVPVSLSFSTILQSARAPTPSWLMQEPMKNAL